MASAFGHAATGALMATCLYFLLYKHLQSSYDIEFGWWIWIVCTILAPLPDIDYFFMQEYESVCGHRGFTHSLLFALLTSIIVNIIVHFASNEWSKNIPLMQCWESILFLLFYFGVTISHSVEDSMVCFERIDPQTGKKIKVPFGISPAYFSPFSNKRTYMCSCYYPILVSPLGIKRFFTPYGKQVLKSEFVYIVVPMSALAVICFVISLLL